MHVITLAVSSAVQFDDINSAIHFVAGSDESTPATKFHHYEVHVRYSNGSEVRGKCPNRQDCIDFLRSLDRI